MRLVSRLCAVVLAVHVLVPRVVQAHEIRPGYLEITEQETGVYKILWKAPSRSRMVFKIEPVLPDECQDQVVASRQQLPGSLVKKRVVNCGPGGLAGKTISIDGLSVTITDVLNFIFGQIAGRVVGEELHSETDQDVHVVPGDMKLADFNNLTNFGIEDSRMTTIGGVAFRHLDRLPNCD